MLLRQYRRRHEHRHLLAVHGRLECSADGHLRFAVADVAAKQPVHRAGFSMSVLISSIARS